MVTEVNSDRIEKAGGMALPFESSSSFLLLLILFTFFVIHSFFGG